MTQQRISLPGSERHAPAAAEPVGLPDPNKTIEVSVIVRRRNAIPKPGTGAPMMSREEFARLYGADPADVRKVEDFAVSENLHVESTDLASRTIVLSGTIADMERAFGTSMELYQHQQEVYRARKGALSVPSDLSGIIEGVFGLDQRPQARTRNSG